jgi:hypothetical protein
MWPAEAKVQRFRSAQQSDKLSTVEFELIRRPTDPLGFVASFSVKKEATVGRVHFQQEESQSTFVDLLHISRSFFKITSANMIVIHASNNTQYEFRTSDNRTITFSRNSVGDLVSNVALDHNSKLLVASYARDAQGRMIGRPLAVQAPVQYLIKLFDVLDFAFEADDAEMEHMAPPKEETCEHCGRTFVRLKRHRCMYAPDPNQPPPDSKGFLPSPKQWKKKK